MNIDDAIAWDRHYRLLRLSRDPDVGAKVTALLEGEIVLEELKRRILTVVEDDGIKAAKDYLKEVYG